MRWWRRLTTQQPAVITPELTLFRTDRLRVRRLEARDLDAMCSVYGDADAMRWVGDAQPLSREACVEWLAVKDRNYATRGYLPSRKREARSNCNRRLVRLLQLLRFIPTHVGNAPGMSAGADPRSDAGTVDFLV